MMRTRDRFVLSFFIAGILCLASDTSAFADDTSPIRVACLGDSITAGARVDAKSESYPARLQELLGDNFEVRNFGIGGATLLKSDRSNLWRDPNAECYLAVTKPV